MDYVTCIDLICYNKRAHIHSLHLFLDEKKLIHANEYDLICRFNISRST